MQAIKHLKPLNFFNLVWICFLVYSPFTYGQTKAETIETGIRRGTLDNGMRYLIHSKAAWDGKPISMRLYVQTGSAMEQEGQSNMAHFMEHLPYAVIRDEGEENYEIVRDAIRVKDLHLQAATYRNVTTYYYKFSPEFLSLYTKGLDLFSSLVGGELEPVPEVVMSEQGSLYQEIVSKGHTKNFRVIAGLSNASLDPVSREALYNHLQSFNWEEVSRFYKDWYHPERATLLLVGPLKDLDVVKQDIQTYFGTLKTSIGRPWENYKSEYFKRPNQFLKLKKEEVEEFEIQESEIYLYWRNQIPPKSEPKALQQKWMYEMLYELIEDYLRQIPATYDLHYTLGIDKSGELPALGLELKTFTGREREAVEEVAAALNQLKEQGIAEVVFQKQKQNILDATNRKDTNALAAVLSTYNQRMLAEESLELNQLALKKNWLNGLSYDIVNSELKAFLEDGPQDIGILAPKGASVLQLSETQFRSWLDEAKRMNTEADEEHETKLIADSLIAQLTQKKSKDLGSDALGGSVLQLANGARVILNPQVGASLKLHGFRNVGASNLNKTDFIKAQLVPKWVHTSGAGAYTHFEMQQMLTDLGMIYGKALYVNQRESGIKLQAPAQRLEALLQLAYLYLSAPREDPEAFRYWKEDEFLFYKSPPYGREEYDLTVLSKKALDEVNPGLTAGERYKSVRQSTMTELKHMYQNLFQHPQEFVFLLSGDFKEAEVIPLLETYLGNLPVSDHQIKREEIEVNTLPIGPLKKVYTIPGILPSDLNLKIQYSYPISRDDWQSQVDLKLISQVIATRLKELRNVKMRGLYLMGTVSSVDLKSQRGNLVFVLPTLKGMEDILIGDVEELIKWFQEHPVSEQELNSIKSNLYVSSIIGNSVSEKAYRYYKWELETPKPEYIEGYLNTISPKDVQQILQQKLVPAQRYIFMGQGTVKSLE
ncbi:putative Zn-dependent peptidase [Leeuwenhoekiella aestuarii]|uniref:M16 family metallopeptidase n=1 Tax=Leeuwenhoekiella aestuarii TaxID=2249426 RepID=UPI000FFEAFD2|nr:insulinase family protein [Leeuwenhoekiella aestuarii]RXG12904.1 putative Zn-dependent peptidase [Leeuwenhoekiella aestuarii]